MLFILLIFAHSLIPEQFRELAEKAIHNSTFKVPKSLREETKYPGNYTFGDAHFILKKVLTSSQTKDIKGYAIEDKYAAIIKRKQFKITDGFAFLDIKTKDFYDMEKIVASDDTIIIYKVRPINMFSVFSDIVMKSKTPMKTFKQGFNWDFERDRPVLSKRKEEISVGVGASFVASVHAKARFKSIKKVEINADVMLNGKIGAEFYAGATNHFEFPDITLIDDIDIRIPGIGFNFKFLGLRFEFDLCLTFGVILKNLQANLNVGVDYYRGYQFTAKRFICIKKHGKSDSGWQTEFSPISSGNTVESIMNTIETNAISAEIQLKQGIKLKIVVISILYSDLQFGLIQSFGIEFGFSPISCPFPYMYGLFSFPMKTYISFGGLYLKTKIFKKRINKRLLKPIYKEILLHKTIKTRKFCLYDSKNSNDYAITDTDDNDEDDNDEFANETSTRMIILNIDNIENIKKTQSLISFRTMLCEFNSSTNSQIQIFDRKISQFEEISLNCCKKSKSCNL